MAWTTPVTRATGDLITAAIYNADLINNIKSLGRTGKIEFFVMASAGYAVENLIDGAWLECNNASVLRASYPAWDAYAAALAPVRPFGAVDATHVSVPDLFGGRQLAHLGSDATVSTLGNSDGVVAANRRGTRHKHTPHVHGGAGVASGGFSNGPTPSGFAAANTGAADGGSGNANDPTDGGAYQVAGIYAVKVI